MRAAVAARKTHKWLNLLIGIQAVLWAVSGLYMVVVPLGIIHGNHLVASHESTLLPADVTPLEITDLQKAHRGIRSVRLKEFLDGPAYVIDTMRGTVLVDAVTGQQLSPLDEGTVRRLAQRTFAGTGEIVRIELLHELPLEVQTRPAPLWRVQFEGWNDPTLYFSPDTGDLLARRSDLWRLFDFMWMLHIMDYDDRQDMNNTLLRIATWACFIASITGLWLLFYSFRRRARSRMSAR